MSERTDEPCVRGPWFPARNSDGKTVADSYRETAAARDRDAADLSRQAAQKRTEAFDYRRKAEQWETEHLAVAWGDVNPGDEISLVVFSRHDGLTREVRTVVAVDWPTIRLAEGEREYEIDATKPDEINRELRAISRAASSQDRP